MVKCILQESTYTIPYPKDFGVFDTNKDGFISIEELADVLSVSPFHPGLVQTFEYADADGRWLLHCSMGSLFP